MKKIIAKTKENYLLYLIYSTGMAVVALQIRSLL